MGGDIRQVVVLAGWRFDATDRVDHSNWCEISRSSRAFPFQVEDGGCRRRRWTHTLAWRNAGRLLFSRLEVLADGDGSVMAFPFARVSISTRRKLVSILLAVTIFAVLAGLVTLAEGHSPVYGVLNAILAGSGVGLFEQFYVQSLRGRWMRNAHPLLSILIYTAVVAVLFFIAINFSHALLHRFYPVPVPYGRLPLILPIVVAFAVIGIVAMRVVHFIGIETLFHLMIGTYHRPVVQQKILVFIDINNSTALAERLGALKIKSLVGKFLFDLSQPITDHGGEIYLYKGDGLIAIWDWHEAVRHDKILRAIDAVFAAVRREQSRYVAQFGVVPSFRIGVHGGDVVVSEQGDTKRSIGIYGSTINIAARMEEAAKAHGIACAISGDVARAFSGSTDRLRQIGFDRIKGISAEISIFEYREAEPGGVAVRRHWPLRDRGRTRAVKVR
jgi:adenylate cyclase